MVTANLNNTGTSVVTGNEGIIVRDNQRAIIGGVTLDVTGFAPEIIGEGHVVIKETSSGNYKPMPVTGNAYASLPAGHTYQGVVLASVIKTKPFVGVSYDCIINRVAAPYGIATIETALKAALPHLVFVQD